MEKSSHDSGTKPKRVFKGVNAFQGAFRSVQIKRVITTDVLP